MFYYRKSETRFMTFGFCEVIFENSSNGTFSFPSLSIKKQTATSIHQPILIVNKRTVAFTAEVLSSDKEHFQTK